MADKTTGKQIISASWRLLKQDKEIAALPVLSAISGIFVTLALAVITSPLWWGSVTSQINSSSDAASGPGAQASSSGSVGFALMSFLLLYASTAVAVFFQVAVAAGAAARLSGEDPTLKTCLAAARSRLPEILKWSLLAATVGTLIRLVAERLGGIGEAIVTAVLSFAWAVATFFVIPVIAVEEVGPKEAFTRSKDLILAKWGKAVRLNLRAGIWQVLTFIPVLALAVTGLALVVTADNAGGSGSQIALGFAVMGLGLLGIIVAGLFWSTLMGYARTILYLHASGHQVPGIPAQVLDDAFAPKKGSKFLS